MAGEYDLELQALGIAARGSQLGIRYVTGAAAVAVPRRPVCSQTPRLLVLEAALGTVASPMPSFLASNDEATFTIRHDLGAVGH